MSKPFKDLTIKDAFMFAAVMVNPDKCGPFLEMVLDMDALLSGKLAGKRAMKLARMRA